ncbi:hypothetical protein V6N11_081025 [Hibiscus sabdariffa]|uniref:RNase H type-1 domain-containing protein n=1 Tax=Hibiscus sabdariffa TaxID=183260 RepID=A0ABR2QJ59_9ROSI
MPLRQWIEVNLSSNSAFGHENEYWDIMFSAVLWNLWIQRNNAIFGNQSEEWASLITRSRWLMDTTREVLTKVSVRPPHRKEQQHPSSYWLPPPMGCFKINSDGACTRLNERASCGGVIRNHLDEWIRGFNCAEAIKLIHQDDRLGGPLIIVHHIREFLKKNWCISYVCINRVNNRVADALATTVNTSDFSLVEFDDPPNFVLPLLQEDMSSFSAPT